MVTENKYYEMLYEKSGLIPGICKEVQSFLIYYLIFFFGTYYKVSYLLGLHTSIDGRVGQYLLRR